jgi:hypothetical protein
MGYLSKLDAVNMMMLSAGESLVADLQEASGIDTGIAEFLLDQMSMEHQTRGIAENKFIKKLQPGANGKIILGYPNMDYLGIIEASLMSSHYTEDRQLIVARVSQDEPPRLYNMTEDKDIWTQEDYYVSIIALLRWEQLDTTTQRAVLNGAMRRYQMLVQGDRTIDQVLSQDEQISRIKARANDVSDKRRNILNDKNAVNRLPYYYGSNRFWKGF